MESFSHYERPMWTYDGDISIIIDTKASATLWQLGLGIRAGAEGHSPIASGPRGSRASKQKLRLLRSCNALGLVYRLLFPKSFQLLSQETIPHLIPHIAQMQAVLNEHT